MSVVMDAPVVGLVVGDSFDAVEALADVSAASGVFGVGCVGVAACDGPSEGVSVADLASFGLSALYLLFRHVEVGVDFGRIGGFGREIHVVFR